MLCLCYHHLDSLSPRCIYSKHLNSTENSCDTPSNNRKNSQTAIAICICEAWDHEYKLGILDKICFAKYFPLKVVEKFDSKINFTLLLNLNNAEVRLPEMVSIRILQPPYSQPPLGLAFMLHRSNNEYKSKIATTTVGRPSGVTLVRLAIRESWGGGGG